MGGGVGRLERKKRKKIHGHKQQSGDCGQEGVGGGGREYREDKW